MSEEIRIVPVSPADAEELLGIYAHYVNNTAVSFEYEPPSVEEFRHRIEHVLEGFPYIAAKKDGRFLGYAYAKAFHERKAYSWVVEVSIYVHKDCRGMGLGRLLYTGLEGLLKAQGVIHLVACVAAPDEEDEYLTHSSRLFHERMGYRVFGHFPRCGHKFGRWYGMLWLSKQINGFEDPQPEIKRLSEL